MRNLELLNLIELSPLSELCGTHCTSIDCDTGTVYSATSTHLVGFDPNNGQLTGIVSLVDEAFVPPDGSGRVVGIQYLADQQAVCAATSTGNLVLWHVTMGQLECVGAVDSGLTSMTWSPDLELLILTTGQNTFIMMTREFDPITENTLHPENFGEAKFVTVGWGKKETQFHGSVGKEAAKQKLEEVKPALPWDDQLPRVSWRGDGQLFVVSTISPDTGARKLRVWNRECEHQSTSENVDGVEQALTWRPSGNLIASTLRRPNKHEVIFFEKNGLRHGEFTLPFGVNDIQVKEMCWNLDSTVLMLQLEDLVQNPGGQTTPRTYVQIWTMNNYHWYLKQSLPFDGTADDKIVSVVWDPEHVYRLHIICSGGKYLQYTWSWATHFSTGISKDNQALVAVIDGDRVLLTPMRDMVTPPPMSAYYLQLPCPVNQVAFCLQGNPNNMALILADGRVSVYTFAQDSDGKDLPRDSTVKFDATLGEGFSLCCQTPTHRGTYSIEGLPIDVRKVPTATHHFVWLTSELLMFCTQDRGHAQNSVLHCAELKLDADKPHLTVKSSIDIESFVYKMAVNAESGSVAIQLCSGSVLKFDPGCDMVLPWEIKSGGELTFPVPCPYMCVCDIGGEEVVVGLTDRYRLYVNDTEIASNCTSLAVHKDYLLLTSLTHTCRCISRQTKVQDLPTLSDGKAHPFDESVRRVERGSRIVCVIQGETKLVLQMPRGNLETIHPRALVLSAVRKYLDSLEFGQAFVCMRKHRLNLNLIYDHCPQSFLDNVQKFVQQVKLVDYINLFLTDLREEDCTVTMYTAAYNRSAPVVDEGTNRPSKVDKVCEVVRQALVSEDEKKYLLSILTSYVRKSTPELEAALLMVKTLRAMPSDQQTMSAEEVLKYLVFLVDVNEMFDVALGTYDFDLVLMVAEKSQKDPKEYIPFLNKLRKLEGHFQLYTIDEHLKRYSNALGHISKCGPEHFETCKTLIQKHKLYTEALQLFPVSSEEYKSIAKLYGDYLSDKRRHLEAGIIYLNAEEWERALQDFQVCLQWRQVFCMTARLKYSCDTEADIARKLAEQMKMKKQYLDAAHVLEQYAKDTEEAIVCLIDGCLWEEALRMMYKYGRTDFIETHLMEALTENYNQQMETLENCKSEFDKYKKRLAVVREEKEKARLEFLESGGAGNFADADLFSDTSSATGESIQSSRYSSESARSGRSSLYSKSSGSSVKNRRKAEHKRWKLKEGSQFEDFALIAALAKLIKMVDDMRDEMNALLRVLLQFHQYKQAADIQRAYDRLLTQMDRGIPEIWQDSEEGKESQPMLGPMTTANSIAQAVQRGQSLEHSQEKLDPVIRIPPTLRKEVSWKLHVLDSGSSKT
ncbi:putative elongator complex protein 1 [Mizuhopecten yessoensis]|uniref:Elongator complex protein 1 n=1 Tax=Mizuhopecten yessoensis TaxID=6573 RepID=A0A210QGQ6_MIZYE|nr:putative elongator complex protein 1 [Mizuhopecten yessoensis]OWF47940.1 Elongator complex protein 1 [Mizuhopecten yessoensis]